MANMHKAIISEGLVDLILVARQDFLYYSLSVFM